MLPEFLCHLVSLPLCMYLYVVRVSISLGLTFAMKGSLCSPNFYVTWSHFRSIWVLVLPEFLCHFVSHPFCTYLYFVRVSMSLGITFFLYESLCYLSFYVTWSHFRYAWVLVFSEFLYQLVSVPLYMSLVLSAFLCHLVSLSFCTSLYVIGVSMSPGLASIIYGSCVV